MVFSHAKNLYIIIEHHSKPGTHIDADGLDKVLEPQTRGDQDLTPLGYKKSQSHMHVRSPKYTEARKDLAMHDRRSSPHYQRKRANISYQARNILQAHGHAPNSLLRQSRKRP